MGRVSFSCRETDIILTQIFDSMIVKGGERDNDYDTILLDILMPGLDGFSVCQEVRRKSNVPILFLTALGGEEDTLKGYALGCDDYMTKPFSLAVLRGSITQPLRRRNRIGSGNCLSCSLSAHGEL